MLYEMLTEILPWVDRNRNWVDGLRRSARLIDGHRQEIIEHTRSGLHKYFEDIKKYTPAEKESITLMLETDLIALTRGPSKLDPADILDLIVNPDNLKQRIEAFETHLDNAVTVDQAIAFNKQSKGLAGYMVHGVLTEWMQQFNVYGIVKQRFVSKQDQVELKNAEEVTGILEHLTSMRALALIDPRTVSSLADMMTAEANRDVEMNGFLGVLGMADSFNKESQAKSFDGNPSQMIKGYVSDIFDEEVSLKTAEYTSPQHRDKVIRQMKSKGFTWIEDLYRDDFDNNPAKMMLFKQDRGIPGYMKGYISLKGQQKRGTGLLDSLFASADPNQASNVTAARSYGMLARMTADALAAGARQFDSAKTPKGVKAAPVYDDQDNIVEFRYVMSKATKKEHLGKRSYIDEVLPAMFGAIEDKRNTKIINEEGIDLMKEEWVYETNKEDSEARFVEIGRNVATEEGREIWSLLPKATRLHAEKVFGAELFYIRDEVVNMVMGARKMSFANNKFLGPAAPFVRMAEKLWQEVIQWERFRIAILNPVVVIGNVISNAMMLASQGIPRAYIWRMTKIAVVSMRKYQKDLRLRDELYREIQGAQTSNQDTRAREAKLARLNAGLNNNPVQALVEEGLFTSIVEEFGIDENTTRKKLANKFVNKFGHITSSKIVVGAASEAMMIPGSNLANMAMMATQYGDFVGRFVKFNWDTKVKGVDRRTAIHEALDSFIYYNIPQNRVLQAFNDNGGLMFTKFFFRIQPIIARTFKRNPVQASIVLGLQHTLDSRSAQENIANYAFMSGGLGKFDASPWSRIWSGEMFEITAFKWIPDFLWKE